MGAFANISKKRRRCFARQRLASVLAGLVLIVTVRAATSSAETGTLHPDHAEDRPVSTSPALLAELDSLDAHPLAAPETNDPPLTRAAAQQRIDEMSPTRWLSRYGRVSIGHRD